MRAGRPDQPLQRGLAAHDGARGIVAVRERGSLDAHTAAGRSARVLGTGGETADSGTVFSYLEAGCFGVLWRRQMRATPPLGS
jgi:hypothetical protein